LLEKFSLDASELPIEQVTAHLDQADDHIRTDFRVFMFDPVPEGLVTSVRQTVKLTQSNGVRVT
jgi:hypothetical protein